MAAKSVFMTGANGGIAKEICKILVKEGTENIAMGCRSEAKGLAARNEIRAATGKLGDIKVAGGFDMLDPQKIVDSVASLPADNPFDAVFLGAGGIAMSDKFLQVKDRNLSFEKTIFQNVVGAHVSFFALKNRGLLSKNCRVVYAGGEGARGIPGVIKKPEIYNQDQLLDYVTVKDRAASYKPMDALGASKFIGALWCQKLAEVVPKNTEVIWFSPGFTYGTDGVDDFPFFQRFVMSKIMFPMMALLGKAQDPQSSARKFADCIQGKIGKNGDLIGAPENTALGKLTDQKPMHTGFTDKVLQDTFWQLLH